MAVVVGGSELAGTAHDDFEDRFRMLGEGERGVVCVAFDHGDVG
jgi:hypothetical protein